MRLCEKERNSEAAQLTILKSSAEATLRFTAKSHLSGERTNVVFFKQRLNVLRADLHGAIFVACDNGLQQALNMIYDCCVRQK